MPSTAGVGETTISEAATEPRVKRRRRLLVPATILAIVLGIVATGLGFALRQDHAAPWLVLLVGLLCTAGVAALIDGMRRAQDKAYALVEALEQKNRELDQTERRYRELVERIPLVTWVDEADLSGATLYISPQVEPLTGFTPEELTREPDLWLSLVHPDDLTRVKEELAMHFASGDPLVSEYRLIARDGSIHWVDDHSVINEVDGTSFSSGYWQDITARKELERQLQQAQRMEAIGLLAGGIAHDFNNILSVITVSSQVLLSEMTPGDPGRADVEEIIRAAERVAALTRQLVAFSRRQVLRPERIDVNETVVSMDRMLSRLLGAEVQFVTELHCEPCLVEVDPGQLEQVMMNLAVNARDAMPHGGVLSISTAFGTFDDGSESVRLLVSDNGEGMDDVVLGRLFEPFFTTKEQGKGTGLGLATVYGIVQQSRGTISVASAPGKGTTFEIVLPLVTAGPERSTGRSVPVLPTVTDERRRRILLVEDNEDVRRTIRRVLERFGHDIAEAVNGEEALEVLRASGPVQLLVTDVAMPKMGGLELVRRLRASDPGLPVVFMSGFPGPEADGIVVETDALTVFMAKPFGPSELIDAIEDLVAATASTRAAVGSTRS